MPNSSQARGRRPHHPYKWLGAGVLGAGVCWAALAGAGVAAADNQADSPAGRHATASDTRAVKPSAARRVAFNAAAVSSAPEAALTPSASASVATASTNEPKPARGRGYEYRARPTICIVYTANAGDNTVSVIDAATSRVTATVPLGGTPKGILASNGTVYVSANGATPTVTEIDGLTNTVVATVGVPGSTAVSGLAERDEGALIYVGGESTVSVIDTGISVATATTFATKGLVAVSSNGRLLATATGEYAPGSSTLALNVFSTATGAGRSTTLGPSVNPVNAIEFSPDGLSVYAAVEERYGAVLRLNTRTGVVTPLIEMLLDPTGLAVSPDGNKVYVSTASPVLYVVDVSSKTYTTVLLGESGSYGSGVGLSLDGRFVYVANTGVDTVTVIRAIDNAVLGTIPVGPNPIAIAVA